MLARTPDFFGLLETLCRHQVDFILVGGLCAILHGAPVVTMDMDIVHDRSPENLDRLIKALKELGAHFRHQFGRRIEPGESHLQGPGISSCTKILVCGMSWGSLERI